MQHCTLTTQGECPYMPLSSRSKYIIDAYKKCKGQNLLSEIFKAYFTLFSVNRHIGEWLKFIGFANALK